MGEEMTYVRPNEDMRIPVCVLVASNCSLKHISSSGSNQVMLISWIVATMKGMKMTPTFFGQWRVVVIVENLYSILHCIHSTENNHVGYKKTLVEVMHSILICTR